MAIPNEFAKAFVRDLLRIRGIKSVTLHDDEERKVLTVLIRCSWFWLKVKWLARRLRVNIQDVLDRSPYLQMNVGIREVHIFPYCGAKV